MRHATSSREEEEASTRCSETTELDLEPLPPMPVDDIRYRTVAEQQRRRAEEAEGRLALAEAKRWELCEQAKAWRERCLQEAEYVARLQETLQGLRDFRQALISRSSEAPLPSRSSLLNSKERPSSVSLDGPCLAEEQALREECRCLRQRLFQAEERAEQLEALRLEDLRRVAELELRLESLSSGGATVPETASSPVGRS